MRCGSGRAEQFPCLGFVRIALFSGCIYTFGFNLHGRLL